MHKNADISLKVHECALFALIEFFTRVMNSLKITQNLHPSPAV